MKKISRILILSLVMSFMCSLLAFADNKTTFTDVPVNSPYYEAVEYLAEKGVVKGCGNRLFNPESKITLNHFATMLVRAFEPVQYKSGPLPVAYSNGWIPVYIVSQDPNSNMRSGAVFECLLTAGNIDVYGEGVRVSWEDYKNTLVLNGAISSELDVNASITRGEVANLFYHVMTKDIKVKMPDILEKINIVNTTSQNTGDYVYVLSQVPECVLDKFNELGWTFKIDEDEIAKYNYENSASAVGLCSYADKTIYVKIQSAVVHEFGHFVDYVTDDLIGIDDLYGAEVNNFIDFMLTSVFKNSSGNYTVENSHEYFADYFQYFIKYRDNQEVMGKMKEATPLTFDYFENLEGTDWSYYLISFEY